MSLCKQQDGRELEQLHSLQVVASMATQQCAQQRCARNMQGCLLTADLLQTAADHQRAFAASKPTHALLCSCIMMIALFTCKIPFVFYMQTGV
jgi:hypothetical protein